MAMPNVFIGSSSEGIEAASAFQAVMGDQFDAILWKDHAAFAAGENTLNALIDAANTADFALFIIRADDVTRSRQKKAATVRDNVLFEYGLFLGVLGKDRVFAVCEGDGSAGRVKIPSDLLGIGIPSFRGASDTSLRATARIALEILTQMKSGRRERRIDLRGNWDFDRKTATFNVCVDPVQLEKHSEYLRDRHLAVVARRHNPKVGVTEDPNVVVGPLCKVPRDAAALQLCVTDKRFTRKPVGKKDRVEGYILAVPPQIKQKDLVAAGTIEQMIRIGCDRCGGSGISILG